MTNTHISIDLDIASNQDPDIPLPSVEQDSSPTSSRQSTPSTSLDVVHEDFTRQTPVPDVVQEQAKSLVALNLESPSSSEELSPRPVSPPSICVSPSAKQNDGAVGGSDLVANFKNLDLELHEETCRPSASRLRETLSPSPSRRRRSRSGSVLNRDVHRIEDEVPPSASFHVPEIQQALSDVKSGVSRLIKVLSSSNMHLEHGSTVGSIHQQGLNLADLQLPSSRIVGLIGDSGVGKSSLINSLLDKIDLARAVSRCCGVNRSHS